MWSQSGLLKRPHRNSTNAFLLNCPPKLSKNQAPPPGSFLCWLMLHWDRLNMVVIVCIKTESSGRLRATDYHLLVRSTLETCTAHLHEWSARLFSAQELGQVLKTLGCKREETWIRSDKLDQTVCTSSGKGAGGAHKKLKMKGGWNTLRLVNGAVTGRRGPISQSPCRPRIVSDTRQKKMFLKMKIHVSCCWQKKTNHKNTEAAISHDFL